MKDFKGKIAVVTGGGYGMGRDLSLQLAQQGCHVAACDVNEENLAETKKMFEALNLEGVRFTTHFCDVANEAQVQKLALAVKAQHESDHINLLFNNAGINGGGSFVKETREDWERTFNICWGGVYYCTRAFLPLLIASEEGHLVNTSSVNGFYASLGPTVPHTAYSTAKFAVKGFSESLIADLRVNAPHVKVSVVMPGHIGTGIAVNSSKVLGKNSTLELNTEEVSTLRKGLEKQGLDTSQFSDEQIKQRVHQKEKEFEEKAPTTSAQAATIILDAVKAEEWRILVGEDAQALDQWVRAQPQDAYNPDMGSFVSP